MEILPDFVFDFDFEFIFLFDFNHLTKFVAHPLGVSSFGALQLAVELVQVFLQLESVGLLEILDERLPHVVQTPLFS